MSSVAYKLALVAAGRLDATWTLVPKHEFRPTLLAGHLHIQLSLLASSIC
jgi:fructose-1,6-bisphosphatase/inositol monophosphatase family enzyme